MNKTIRTIVLVSALVETILFGCGEKSSSRTDTLRSLKSIEDSLYQEKYLIPRALGNYKGPFGENEWLWQENIEDLKKHHGSLFEIQQKAEKIYESR